MTTTSQPLRYEQSFQSIELNNSITLINCLFVINRLILCIKASWQSIFPYSINRRGLALLELLALECVSAVFVSQNNNKLINNNQSTSYCSVVCLCERARLHGRFSLPVQASVPPSASLTYCHRCICVCARSRVQRIISMTKASVTQFERSSNKRRVFPKTAHTAVRQMNSKLWIVLCVILIQ